MIDKKRCSLHTAWYEMVHFTYWLIRNGAVYIVFGTKRCSLHTACYETVHFT